MNHPKPIIVRILIPIVLIILAVGVGKIIIKTAHKPKRKHPQKNAYQVEVKTLKAIDQAVHVRVTGTVIPARKITLRARVSGEIIKVSPNFIDGGRFKKGEEILRIDPVDYKLALAQREAAVAEAQFQLKLEEGQHDIAAHEWALISKTSGKDEEIDKDLALRTPHLKFRKARLAAAKAELEKAKLNLSRTILRAPFNTMILERKTDVGTQANMQEPLAILTDTDEYYVRALVPIEELKWIQIGFTNGSPATISRTRGEPVKGRVIRLEGQLQERGRMAQILISIKNPLQDKNPLLINEYVHLNIQGTVVKNSYRIPRFALRDDHFVWLLSKEKTLKIRKIKVYWRDAQSVLVSDGLHDGERLILTNLSTPIEGMKLRLVGDKKNPSATKKKKGMKPHAK